MAVSRTLPTGTGVVRVVVEDRHGWKEEALALLCEQAVADVLRRLAAAEPGALQDQEPGGGPGG